MNPAATPLRILVVFNTVKLYGMERAVLRAFELLAPAVEAHFVLSRTCRGLDLPIWREIKRLGFAAHFLSDHRGWPKLSFPRRAGQLPIQLWVAIRGNLDVFLALRKSGARALLFPSPSYAFFGLLGALYCRLRGWPTFLQFHNLELQHSLRLRLLTPLLSTFLHCTERGKEMTLRANPYLRGKKHHVISNRTGLACVEPLGLEGTAERRRLVYVGQLEEHKGLDLMLEAFSLIADRHPDVDLHILGDGSPEYVSELRRRALPHTSRIFFRGFIDEVEPILGGAAAHLFPTPPSRYHEAFGNVAVEAMALGVPSVTFASGAVPSIVSDGETGFVIESEDPADFAAGIERLLSDPELRERMGNQARERYQSHFSDPQILHQWLSALGLS